MSQPKFVIGDNVYLKSGGPKMTVTNVRKSSGSHEGYIVNTQWFVGQKVNSTSAHEDSFTADDPNPKKDNSEKK